MHGFALKLGLVLAAEKSKTPFYIAGGVLVAWALFVSLGIGMRKPSFPETLAQQRAIMGVSVLLVAFAVSMAVVTAGGPKSTTATASTGPAPSTPATPGTPSTPTATTGTPAPPSSPAAGASTASLEANPTGSRASTRSSSPPRPAR